MIRRIATQIVHIPVVLNNKGSLHSRLSVADSGYSVQINDWVSFGNTENNELITQKYKVVIKKIINNIWRAKLS